MEERKGFLTPDQEKLLDEVIVIKNKLGEAIDGATIQLIDNQGLERLKSKLSPEALEVVYEIVDLVFAGLEQITEE